MENQFYLARLSYILLGPALFGLVVGVWMVSQYWADGPFDPTTGNGNSLYHSPINFEFAARSFLIAGACLLGFLMCHGPFDKH